MCKILLTSLVLLLFAGSAVAGVVLEIDTKTKEDGEYENMSIRMAVQDGNLKMSMSPTGMGVQHEMIYRGDRMISVSHPQQMYFVMDKASMRGMQNQMNEAMGEMQKALDNLEGEERAMAEKMMKGLPGMAQEEAAPQVESRKTGETKKVGDYDCTRYEMVRDGEIEQVLWVTDWKNIKGGSEVASTLDAFMAFMDDMMGPMRQGFDDSPFAHWKDLSGCPVLAEHLEDGEVVGESVLRSATKQDISPTDFDAPDGYKQQSMSGGPR